MRRALGRGLAQLLDIESAGPATDVPVSAIVPNPRQPRLRFDDAGLEELAASIREVGLLQPVIVRPLLRGKYELIAGERRWRAAKLAGLSSLPAIVRSASSQAALELALTENLQREDIGPLERATAFRRLMDEFDLTQEQVSQKIGISRPAVANSVRLLKLPRRIREGIQSGEITEGHARALLALNTEAEQLALFERVISKALSVRQTEDAVRRFVPGPGTQARNRASKASDPYVLALENRLSTHFGLPVRLQRAGKGGRVVIEFHSDEELQRALDLLGIEI